MLEFKIFTPSNIILERDNCNYISLSNEQGEFGIHPHHEKLATFCSIGIITLHRQKYTEKIYVSQGNVFIDYFSVIIFCEYYFLKEDINLENEKNKLNALNNELSENKISHKNEDIFKQLEDCKFKISLF